MKNLLRSGVVCLAFVAFLAIAASPAYAYKESTTTVLPAGTPSYSCPTCHSLEAGATSPTVASRSVPSTWTWDTEAGTNVGTRKGPHGGYTPGTQKCQSCHDVHDAPSSVSLLPQATVLATCNTCHDGTGGGGVYGVIKFRTGTNPVAQHRIEVADGTGGKKMVVPGGDAATGASVETSFTGTNASLTCTDCHSPHNSKTVKPFRGDRRRSITDTTTANTVATNRLLLARPTSATTTATEYGSDWCEACHKGRHSQTTSMGNHPVADSVTAANWYYRRVEVLTGYNTSVRSATPTDLGGSNLGFVMPEPRGSQPYPICQQCHADVRQIGDVTQFQVDSVQESFTVSPDGVSGGNPKFQVFPHESQNPSFLVETYDDLCLNCHVAP